MGFLCHLIFPAAPARPDVLTVEVMLTGQPPTDSFLGLQVQKTGRQNTAAAL
jgi:hypothetical protein